MAGHAAKHDYHLVDPSPWPVVGSIGAFLLAVGGVAWMKGLVGAEHPLAIFLAEGQPYTFFIGVFIIGLTMFGWWGDMIKEGKAGAHTPVVDIGLRYGMILFIASEVMFFVAWFWMFFEAALFHEVRAAEGWIQMFGVADDPQAYGDAFASWPPPGVETFDPWHIPLMNTLVLLLSGTTVTWAHHALQHGDRKGAQLGLLLTVILGVCFTALQIYEYDHAQFAFSRLEGGNIYTSTFFLATGFHGAHVVIGTIFLAVCLFRLMGGGFSKEKHFGMEAAAWYWHFVDVVWLFLFAFVYVIFQ